MDYCSVIKRNKIRSSLAMRIDLQSVIQSEGIQEEKNKYWGSFIFFELWFSPDIWEKAMAPHSNTLAWQIPWTEEPGGLLSMGSRRVGHN